MNYITTFGNKIFLWKTISFLSFLFLSLKRYSSIKDVKEAPNKIPVARLAKDVGAFMDTIFSIGVNSAHRGSLIKADMKILHNPGTGAKDKEVHVHYNKVLNVSLNTRSNLKVSFKRDNHSATHHWKLQP